MSKALSLDLRTRVLAAVYAVASHRCAAERFGTGMLALPGNREALADLSGQWIERFHDRNGLKYIALDMGSSVSPTHGEQEGAAWNGHFDCTCYHPLFVFNKFGLLERCALRHGNAHSADGWQDVLDPVIARYAKRDIMRFFRADAAYAISAIYERLEEAGYLYAIRLPANAEGRAPADPARGGPVADQGQSLLRRLPLQGAKLGCRAPRDREDRMASGRAVPSRGLHRH